MNIVFLRTARVFVFAFISLFIFSCTKDEPDSDFTSKYLVDREVIRVYTREQVKNLLLESGMLPSDATLFIKHGVSAIRITYKTVTPQGEQINASGALVVPNTADPIPMVSFQHGTITNEASAPSNFQSGFTELATLFASAGFILSVPDYLGYGESKHIEHPYEHRASLATACRDMLRASYEYFKEVGVDLPNDKLFLSGYSEGGFATMAMFKLLQEEHPNEFNITAVTVGSGAYNKSATVDWVVNSNENQIHINTFVWVLDVYNKLYPQLQRPYSYYFNEPYATQIANHGVFTPIETNPSLLLTESFISSYNSGLDTDFIAAVQDNDCFNWKPLAPLRLYHGTDDNLVPYFNSQTAFQAMTQLGATNVELVTITNGTHESAILDYAMGTFLYFRGFLQN